MKQILIIICSLAYGIAFSQNWTGAVNSEWNNASNWSSWPLSGVNITIDPINYSGVGASPIINANSVFIPGAILINNGGQLVINSNLSTTDDVECLGANSQIIQNSGTFNVNPSNGGRFIIDLGASYTLNNGTVNVGERFIAGENATVTIQNGIATSGERLLMDLGGQFNQNGGTVNVAAVFAMADGSPTQASGYTLNDGALNVTGEFAIECEAGDFEPFFHQNGGALTVNGDMFWLGIAPGSGRGSFVMNNGVATINGLLQNMPGSTIGMQMEVHNSSILTLSGTIAENQHPTDSLLQTGNSNIIFTNASGSLINQGVVQSSGGSFTIEGNNTFQGNGVFKLHTLDIVSSGVLIHGTTSPIEIQGNLVHNGNFVHQNHQLIINGLIPQTISGGSTLTTFDLTIDKSAGGVTLNTPVVVENFLDLQNGITETSGGNTVKLTASANSNQGNANSFISGPMEKEGNSAYIFPIGKNGVWARLGITAPSQITDLFRAEYFNTSFSSLSPINSPLSAVSGLEYWNLEQAIGTSAVMVELYWEDAGISAITDCNELSIGQWNGNAWENLVSSTSGSCTNNGQGAIQTANAVSTFGAFTFGFYSGVTTQELSICNGNSISVGSNTYASSGNYVDVLQDVNMNDSIVITALTVVVVDQSVLLSGDTLVSGNSNADNYSWLSCTDNMALGITSQGYKPTQSGYYAVEVTQDGCVDTSNCIYYTLMDTTICQGEAIQIGNSNYVTSGEYLEQLTTSNMEDSLIFLTLSVSLVDTAFVQSGIQFVSNNSNATHFQWFDCTAGNNLPNDTLNTFTPTTNGSYALIVEENGCIDTSSCFVIMNVGIDEVQNEGKISLYPNPTNGSFTINSEGQNGTYSIYNLAGELLISQEFIDNQTNSMDLQSGIYLIKIAINSKLIYSDKFIVQ